MPNAGVAGTCVVRPLNFSLASLPAARARAKSSSSAEPPEAVAVESEVCPALWPDSASGEATEDPQDLRAPSVPLVPSIRSPRSCSASSASADGYPSGSENAAEEPDAAAAAEGAGAADYSILHLWRHRGYHLREKTKNIFFFNIIIINLKK